MCSLHRSLSSEHQISFLKQKKEFPEQWFIDNTRLRDFGSFKVDLKKAYPFNDAVNES